MIKGSSPFFGKLRKMRYLVLGFFITFFFKNQIFKNYNINNQKISTSGIFSGWIFQEYIKGTFNLTGGKFLITNWELKDQIVLKILDLLNNILNIIYLSTLTEIFFYLSLIYFVCINKLKHVPKKHLKIIKLIFCFIYLHDTFLDIIFLITPFFLFLVILFNLSVLILNWYILYLFLLKKVYLKKTLVIAKTIGNKTFFYTFFTILFLILNDMQLDFFCNNLPKEIYFKFLFLFFN